MDFGVFLPEVGAFEGIKRGAGNLGRWPSSRRSHVITFDDRPRDLSQTD